MDDWFGVDVYERNPGSTRCTAARSNGRFCDGESLPDAPFPICLHHAAEVMRFLASHVPRNADDRTVALARGIGQDRKRRAPAEELHERKSVVYYLRVGALIKIGTTTNLPARLHAYPPDSRVLAVEPGGLSVEKQRHLQFADDLRHGNEWFAPSDSLIEHIDRVREARVA